MKKPLLLASLITSILLSACSEPEITASQQAPSVAIDVSNVAYEEVQSWHTYTTRLEAPEVVTLTPRVSGTIQNVSFVEGQMVKAGDVLFQIDPRPFQAEVSRLKAQISSAETALEQAQKREVRALNLGRSSAISEEQIEDRTSITKQRLAQLTSLKAELEAAQLNLDFTSVKAPIDGLISRAEITQGNTINANQSVLTTIVSTDKMYAYFNIDERTWNSEFQNITATDRLPVSLELTGDNRNDYLGYVDFIDNTVNPSTGTLRVRAQFDTSDMPLRAGSFARLLIASTDSKQQVLIPERAIGTDLKNQFVLTVNDNNTLEYRQVTVGDRFGKFRAINKGLTQNDKIAVNGPAKVGPGMTITPRVVSLDLSSVELKVSTFKPTKNQLALNSAEGVN